MARQISVDINEGVKELITQISGYEDGSEPFVHIQKYFLNKLKNSDTMYFLNKRDVDRSITGMAEKFNFHGFFRQAKALQEAYDNYIPHDLPKATLTNRLNIVEFLLCLSDKPTSKFLEMPEEFEVKQSEVEDEINWAEYLKEGIEEWAPNFDESSECSASSSVADDFDEPTEVCGTSSIHIPQVIRSNEKDVIVNLRENREELLNTIQHTWYNQDQFHDAPFSDWKEANVGINWEFFLEKQVMGLIVMPKVSVLSEYKVIREVLWQFWNTHASSVFEFEGNSLKPKENVMIASVRSMTLESFLKNQFIPHIEILEFFREFSDSLAVKSDECYMSVPQTYRSYNNSLLNIISPIYVKLSQLEDKIRDQESTYTLLNLARDLGEILEPVFSLKKIHDHVILEVKKHSNLTCASTLLARLHESIEYSESKLDQDLRVTLYLESLYYNLDIIDSWLMKNDLSDYTGEFFINNRNRSMAYIPDEDETDQSISETDICKLNFDLYEELDDSCKENGVIKIIRQQVLQIGRNLHLLRLLGEFSLLNESRETIHEEFVRKTLEELCEFYNVDPVFAKEDTSHGDSSDEEDDDMKYKYPVVCTDDCKNPTEMDKLENLVDTTDGFLMLAFEDYFIEKPKKREQVKLTLFERISRITTDFFSTSSFFEKILSGILKERFTVSGLMVKNLLTEQYFLEKQFQFLRHTFLFFDNLIFPFYMRLFQKTDSCIKKWGNDIRLTSHLQDIIVDTYPEFYDKCSVQVGENWKLCTGSLEACNMINLEFEIQWPLNIIISSHHMALYKDVFRIILKMKWGLYTLNHLYFTDLEPKRKNIHKSKPKSHKSTIMKLKYLKFALTNLLTSIQHYIFSFVFMKCLQKFELDFEKANDLSSIVASHSEFITTVYSMTVEIRNSGKEEDAFGSIFSCVKALKTMWKNVEKATPDRLKEYCNVYEKSYSIISPIICPSYLFSY